MESYWNVFFALEESQWIPSGILLVASYEISNGVKLLGEFYLILSGVLFDS